MKIIIFGVSGRVGSELSIKLREVGHDVRALTRKDAELTNPYTAVWFIEHHKPDVVINATAYNGLEQCQADPLKAYTINTTVPAIMAMACKTVGALFIHFSTDYVFSGSHDKLPLTEMYPTEPCGLYGRTKLNGEQSALLFNDKTLIFRLSSIYGRVPGGPIDALVQARNGKGSITNPIMVLHQYCAPTSARLVANAVAYAIKSEISEYGIYNIATLGGIWKKDFSERILKYVFPHETYHVHEGNLPVSRPIYTQLDVGKFSTHIWIFFS